MTLTLGPLISLIAGILILVVPRLLNYIVAVYLIAMLLVQMFGEEGTPSPEPASLPRARRLYLKYRPAAVNFLLGTLLNVYTIFFFKSSSLLVSFAFMGVLVLLLLANEAKRLKALGLSLKFALLSLCFLCFAAAVVPVFTGSIGLPVFLLSMAVGSLPLIGAGLWIRVSAPEK